jgi:hypothetical protein
MMGTVFSNTPLKQVFADTRRFQANLAIVESNVFFLDKNSKTLAWFIGGGLATGGGISGGTGDWTPL